MRAYRAAWRRITVGWCSRLSDRRPTTARAVARVIEAAKGPKPYSRSRKGRPNVEGGGHNRGTYVVRQDAAARDRKTLAEAMREAARG